MRTLAITALALTAAALSACGPSIGKNDPDYAEMVGHKAWLDQLKRDDPETGHLIAQQCADELGFGMSKQKVLELSRCMRRKYDEGVRG
jgi:outer membrane protein assembly factor BamE (lipoprotein component of BamABCDE complex)